MKYLKGELKKEIIKSREMYMMLAPFALLFFIFTILPIFAAVVLSFTNFNMVLSPKFIGLLNYSNLILNSETFMLTVKNTFIFAVITGPISYFLCLFFAWLINQMPRPLRVLLTFLYYIPSISGSVFIIWSYIFSSDIYGFVNSTLINLRLLNEPVQWLTDTRYMLIVIIIVQIWASLGTSFLAFIAGLQGVDSSLYEAGAIDGIANRFQELRLITLPSMGPQLMFAAVIQIGAAFSVSNICIQLAGFPSTDYAADTVVTHILDYGTLRFEMGTACAIASMLFVFMISLNGLIEKFIKKNTNL